MEDVRSEGRLFANRMNTQQHNNKPSQAHNTLKSSNNNSLNDIKEVQPASPLTTVCSEPVGTKTTVQNSLHMENNTIEQKKFETHKSVPGWHGFVHAEKSWRDTQGNLISALSRANSLVDLHQLLEHIVRWS